jgi:chemotaxis protein histidine kinase CheA
MTTMTISESSMAMMLSKRAMKNVESMALDMARQTITECAALYGFSAEDAMDRLGASTITLRTEEKVKKPKTEKAAKAIKSAFPLPFNGAIQSDCCQGIKANRGLYSQCAKSCKKDSQFCNACAKQAEKNTSGEPDCGVIAKRMLDGDSWRDPKGRAPISFRQLMKKLKLTEDEVLAEVSRLGASFDAEKHFAAEPAKESKRGRQKKAVTSDTDSDASPKKRGRPKKAAKVVEVSATEDLFANLVEQAKTQEADVSDLSGSDSDSDAGSKKSSKKQKLTEAEKAEKKAARDAEKAKAKEEKEAKEAQEKAVKKAARDAEKAKAKEAKEAKEAQEKAEKKAARDADKAKAKEAKEAKEKADKEAKAAAKAAKAKKSEKAEAAPVASEELTPEAEEEEAVKVEKFEIKGTMYLKSADNTLYDIKTQDEIGVWNPDTKEIEEQEEDSDED